MTVDIVKKNNISNNNNVVFIIKINHYLIDMEMIIK